MHEDVDRRPFLLQRKTLMPPLVEPDDTYYDAERCLTVRETEVGPVPYVRTPDGAMGAKTFLKDHRPGED